MIPITTPESKYTVHKRDDGRWFIGGPTHVFTTWTDETEAEDNARALSAAYLEGTKEKKGDPWISASEQLPVGQLVTEGKQEPYRTIRVLGYCSGRDSILEMIYDRSEDGTWQQWLNADLDEEDPPTHWMPMITKPLPPPPASNT